MVVNWSGLENEVVISRSTKIVLLELLLIQMVNIQEGI